MTESFGIALIGTGYMGKCHALAYNAVNGVFSDCPKLRLEMLCDINSDAGRQFAEAFGFKQFSTEWRDALTNPAVDIISITTPNGLHKEMALAALAAGKHVYCEKPLALTLADAGIMAVAARKSGLKTLVGYNYLYNPAILNAARLIKEGAIGRVYFFRGVNDEDYMADPALPHSWRCEVKKAGTGTLGDLAVHLVSLAHLLMGNITQLTAQTYIAHKNRLLEDHPDKTGTVDNEDIASAFVSFESGARGELSSSRSAWGRKNHLTFEIHGDAGMITFDQERMNELRLYSSHDKPEDQGFRIILTGPEHPPYASFIASRGHQLGFNDLKTMEVANLLRGLAGRDELYPDFDDALRIERVIHGMVRSSETGSSITL
ncbi:MAG: myo-inositol 2-dehydrogenase [Alphaproteobacteria bacterium]|nr:MAG: myo-inositol 2-dehydrogenase [Alphaproteobacteria bacterium]